MFLRFYLTYLALVVIPVVVLGLVILQRTGGDAVFSDLAWQVLPIVFVTVAVAAILAYWLTRSITQPLHELEQRARQLADGDFTQKVHVIGSQEFVTLSQAFNTMTERLAESFREIEFDREQLRIILSGMDEGVIALDDQQHILFANDRAGDLLEFSPKLAVGRVLWEVTRQRALREVVERALIENKPQKQQVEWQSAVEKFFTLYVSRLSGEKTRGSVLVIHDLTDVTRLERVRQDFVANVSHELKTPLANIKSSVDALIDGAMDEPQARGLFLAEISEQADRQLMLIEDLLSLARIESTENGLTPEKVLVDDAVHSCLDRHRTRAEAKGHTLDGVALAGTPSTLALWVDEEGMAQLLDNLVDNAIKYTPPNGFITVRWRAKETTVQIEVEDSGIGVPEADIPHIFERFYRVDKARSREMGGTGLGLAIVKHLVQGMKGTISVKSQPGMGTTFLVELPRQV